MLESDTDAKKLLKEYNNIPMPNQNLGERLVLGAEGPGAGVAMNGESRYSFTGDAALQAPIEAALRGVVDPEMSLDIVDLGLVYGVDAHPSGIRVRLTMTSAACPVAELIVEDTVKAIGDAVGGDVPVDVELVWDPAWTPERMSARAREAMGWD